MKTIGVIVIAFAMLIALTGVVMADQVVPAVPEVQGITSQVSIVCEGTVMNSASVGMQLTDMDMYDTGLASRGVPLPGTPTLQATWGSMLDPTQVQYSSTYDANTIAQKGQTTFIKQMAVGTGNKLLTQSNIKATTESTYLATGDGGNILGTESIMIDGAGMPTMASDRILCPFGNAGDNVIPAYCNIAMANSKYDLIVGSVVSTADDRFIGTDATLPVVLNYAINVKPYTIQGQGQSPAMGSVSSAYKVSIKEGRSGYIAQNISALAGANRLLVPANYQNTWGGQSYALNDLYIPKTQVLNWADVAFNMGIGNMTGIGIGPQNEDITYSESSSAAGIISSYSAGYQYQSGKVLI